MGEVEERVECAGGVWGVCVIPGPITDTIPPTPGLFFAIHTMGVGSRVCVSKTPRALGTVPQLHQCLLRCDPVGTPEALPLCHCGACGSRNSKKPGGRGCGCGCGSGQAPGPHLTILLTSGIHLDLGLGALWSLSRLQSMKQPTPAQCPGSRLCPGNKAGSLGPTQAEDCSARVPAGAHGGGAAVRSCGKRKLEAPPTLMVTTGNKKRLGVPRTFSRNRR